MDSNFIFLDRIDWIDWIFFAYGEKPFVRSPFYPVDPAQLLIKDTNSFFLNPYLKQHAVK